MKMRFVHETFSQRVHFAAGAAADAVAEEVDRLGSRRVMLIAAPSAAELARAVTARVPVTLVHDEVAMHVPVPVAERARAAASEHSVDVVISVGGGSATGLAKAIALTSGLPVIAVPTTYAGSEATDVWGLTDDAHKITGSDPRVLPRAVVYDASLTLTLPVDLSVASGLNGLAHCVDALWAPRADPINAALATEGIRTLAQGLRLVVDEPTGLGGREQALCGAYLAAVAFASAGSGLHHKICHVLGGRYNLPHAATHAIMLPHVVALNAPAAPRVAERIAEALGAATALGGLQELRVRLDAPKALRDHGFREEQIGDAIEAILPVVPDSNPAKVTADNLGQLLQNAWEGAEAQ